jgi:ABC-2 type transport system permease protein
MRSLAEEFRTGTFELLKTSPLSGWQIVLGKYLSICLVIAIVILPTITYVFTVQSLSATGGIDMGALIGSYLGLFLLAALFAAISLCCSSFTSNTVAAFLISTFMCLVLYYGFTALSRMPALQGNADYYIEMAGIDFHYRSISRGVVDSRDLVYFLSASVFFLLITVKNVNRK